MCEPMKRLLQLLWAIFVLPIAMIAFAVYIVCGFIWLSVFASMADEIRDPCERFGYHEMLQRNKQRIAS